LRTICNVARVLTESQEFPNKSFAMPFAAWTCLSCAQ
jgi:hypothetical protein